MSITMAVEAPRSGPIAKILERLFGAPRPSPELKHLNDAATRLENAALKIEKAAGKIDAAVDPIGELVDGLRKGPEERNRTRKRKSAATAKKSSRAK